MLRLCLIIIITKTVECYFLEESYSEDKNNDPVTKTVEC